MNNDVTLTTNMSGQLATTGETASSAAAAKAKALVEARYIMALRNPRNWAQVRQDLLAECSRPAFAHNKSAFYIKPIGDGVEGLGIRFVEVAIRCMKNVTVETETVYEDEHKEVHRVTVTDLESNVPWSLDVPVEKSVERSRPASDGSYIRKRKNSYNKDVYTVPAEGDDLLNKRGAQISKAVRTLGLRIIPGDLQDEAEALIKKIRMDKAAQDPSAERNNILDSFSSIGVRADDLLNYLGHSIETCSPSEYVHLRGLFGAIKDGEATWASVMSNKDEQDARNGKEPAQRRERDQAEPEKKALPAYPEAMFVRELPMWHKLIANGKQTVQKIIANAETRYSLSAEQKKLIAEPPQPEQDKPAAEATKAQPAQSGGAPIATAEKVEKRLRDAKNMDQLNEAADLINALPADQQKPLEHLFDDLRTNLI